MKLLDPKLWSSYRILAEPCKMRFPCCPGRRWGHSTSTVRTRSQATRSTSFARIPICLSFFRFWSHPPFLSHKTWPPARARRARRARRRAFWLKDTAETGPWDAILFRVGGLVVPKFQSQLGSSSPKGKKKYETAKQISSMNITCVPG